MNTFNESIFIADTVAIVIGIGSILIGSLLYFLLKSELRHTRSVLFDLKKDVENLKIREQNIEESCSRLEASLNFFRLELESLKKKED